MGSFFRKFRGASRKSGSNPKNPPQYGDRPITVKFRGLPSWKNTMIINPAIIRSGISCKKACLEVFLPFVSPVPMSQ